MLIFILQCASVNYCFAPEYRYPCQILQYNQTLDYLNKHAEELHDILTELGVEHSYYFVDADVEVLNHGYLSSFETSPHAKESLDQCVEFIRGKVGINL